MTEKVTTTRLVAPPKPGSGGREHRPLGAGVTQRVVFAAVLADAEMVERALDIDVHAMCAAAVQAAAAPRGGRRAAGAGG